MRTWTTIWSAGSAGSAGGLNVAQGNSGSLIPPNDPPSRQQASVAPGPLGCARINDVDVFDSCTVLYVRDPGNQPALYVVCHASHRAQRVALPTSVGVVTPGANLDFGAPGVNFTFESPTLAPAAYYLRFADLAISRRAELTAAAGLNSPSDLIGAVTEQVLVPLPGDDVVGKGAVIKVPVTLTFRPAVLRARGLVSAPGELLVVGGGSPTHPSELPTDPPIDADRSAQISTRSQAGEKGECAPALGGDRGKPARVLLEAYGAYGYVC
jgi:hypothetical protein